MSLLQSLISAGYDPDTAAALVAQSGQSPSNASAAPLGGLLGAVGTPTIDSGTYGASVTPSNNGAALMTPNGLGGYQVQGNAGDAANQAMIDSMQRPKMGVLPQGLPYTSADAWPNLGTGAPTGFGSGSAYPQVPQVPQAPQASAPAPRGNVQARASAQPQGLLNINWKAQGDLPQVDVNPTSVANGVTAEDDQNPSDLTQPARSGLLGSFNQTTEAVTQAAQSPETSGNLLGAVGDRLKTVGDKLTNLSPEAAQSLIVGGLQMLRANDGTHNLGQIVGEGGIAGVGNYQALEQQKAANQLASQKAALEQNRWMTETNLKTQQQSFDQQYRTQQAQFEGYKFSHPNLVPTQTTDATGNAVTMFVDPQTGRVAPNSPALAAAPKYAQVDTGGGVSIYNENRPQAGPVANFNKSPTPQMMQQQSQPTDGQIKDYDATDAAIRTQRATAEKANATATALMQNPGDNGAIAARWNSFIGDPGQTQIQYDQTIQAATKANLSGLGSGSGISDKDMLFAAKGMPGPNASAADKAQFLRGYAKIQSALADQNQDINDFARANGRFGQGPAQAPVTVNGITLPAGTNAGQFAAKAAALRSANNVAMQSDADLKKQAGNDGAAFHTLEVQRAQARQFIETMRQQKVIK